MKRFGGGVIKLPPISTELEGDTYIHLINGDIITAWEPVKEDGKDLITRFGEADPDDLLEIGDNASSMAFIPVRNIMFISRRQRCKP